MTKQLVLFFGLILASYYIQAEAWQEALLDIPQQQTILVAPTKNKLLLLAPEKYPNLPEATHYLLGGSYHNDWYLDFDDSFYRSATLIDLSIPIQQQEIALPGLALEIKFSPDASYLAAVILTGKQLTLWRYDIATASWHPWSDLTINGITKQASLIWSADSQSVIVRSLSSSKKNTLKQKAAQLRSAQNVQQGRLYRDLLNTPDKKALFTHHWQQTLIKLSLSGVQTPLWSGLVENFSLSPQGDYLLITALDDNLSASLTLARQARRYYVIDMKNQQTLTPIPDLKSRTNSLDKAALGSRLVQWLPQKKATLAWINALNEKSPTNDRPVDEYRQLAAPFDTEAETKAQFNWRVYQWEQAQNGQMLVATWIAKSHQLKWTLFGSDFSENIPLSLYDYKVPSQDPGNPVVDHLPDGRRLLKMDSKHQVWFFKPAKTSWQYASMTAKLTELDRNIDWDVLYRPNLNDLSSFLAISTDEDDLNRYWWVTHENETPLSHWGELNEFNMSAYKNIQLKGNNGLTGQVYLPNKGKAPWPVLIWLYPDPKYQPQPAKFSAMSPYVALKNCIAVLDMTGQETMPSHVIDQKSYLKAMTHKSEQLYNLIKQSPMLDADNIALMGHSFGANAVVSTLAASNKFKTGIARSGAYNRTLTPLGFQSEKRTLWEESDNYLAQSPFLLADKITKPLLLIHGEADQNPGTMPLQSEQLFNALEYHNSPAQLLMLPNEGHQYKQRKNLKTLLKVQSDWLKENLLTDCHN
ncbi:prolyl oligopeptidase family serine peptidase [uncultured Shewanella sp.]|uniref:alpha/beta hydrolase family protein n=1 Tax=uncultured Shewanella sp. TaxID=173975 RepID=UPI00260834EA|nr:prolyl oligopeptidase family serine peptidase [uncultured Shewanella sp.]